MGKNSLLMFSELTFNETEVRTQKLSGVSTEYSTQGKFSTVCLNTSLNLPPSNSTSRRTKQSSVVSSRSVSRNILTHSFLKVYFTRIFHLSPKAARPEWRGWQGSLNKQSFPAQTRQVWCSQMVQAWVLNWQQQDTVYPIENKATESQPKTKINFFFNSWFHIYQAFHNSQEELRI